MLGDHIIQPPHFSNAETWVKGFQWPPNPPDVLDIKATGRNLFFQQIFKLGSSHYNLSKSPPIYWIDTYKINLVIRGCRAFNSKTFFKQLLSWVVMISIVKCIPSFTPWSHYDLIKNPWNNFYYGICMSFVQADAGLLGNLLGQAVPQSAPQWTSTH